MCDINLSCSKDPPPPFPAGVLVHTAVRLSALVSSLAPHGRNDPFAQRPCQHDPGQPQNRFLDPEHWTSFKFSVTESVVRKQQTKTQQPVMVHHWEPVSLSHVWELHVPCWLLYALPLLDTTAGVKEPKNHTCCIQWELLNKCVNVWTTNLPRYPILFYPQLVITAVLTPYKKSGCHDRFHFSSLSRCSWEAGG